MIDLSFNIEGCEAPAHAVAPLLMFKLRVADADAATAIHSLSLRCQVRIEPTRRQYAAEEQTRLVDLFGEPSRWGQTLRSMLWAHTTAVVPPFIGSTVVDLPVPCTFDFNIAATKYFDAIRDGTVPLCFLFSGTIFYAGEEDGGLQIMQIPWEKESNYRLPIATWRTMMDHYYPNSAWLNVRKDVFDRLSRFKSETMLPSWEKVFERLLDHAEEAVI